jgi:hypothetical protein
MANVGPEGTDAGNGVVVVGDVLVRSEASESVSESEGANLSWRIIHLDLFAFFTCSGSSVQIWRCTASASMGAN